VRDISVDGASTVNLRPYDLTITWYATVLPPYFDMYACEWDTGVDYESYVNIELDFPDGVECNKWYLDAKKKGDVNHYYEYYIENRSPELDPIVVENPSVELGVPIIFHGSGSDPEGDSISYEWHFGDGEWSTEKDPTHTYADIGTYTVSLKVRDYFGAYSQTRYATVQVVEELYHVVRGNNDRIYYQLWDGTSWMDWHTPPGATEESPSAVVYQNYLHMVVRGTDGRIYHGRVALSTNSFSGWTQLTGFTPSAPELTVGNGGIILVVRGMDNRIYYRQWNGIQWGDWATLPGSTCDSPAAVAVGPNLEYLAIAVRGSNERSLWFGSVDLDTDTFSGWDYMSGSTPSRPVITAFKKGTPEAILYFIVHGFDNNLYYKWAQFQHVGTSWSDWGDIGFTHNGPAATVVGDRLHIIVEGHSGTLYHGFHSFINVYWSGWDSLSGSTPSPPELAEPAP
jgi:PKD repeat protein